MSTTATRRRKLIALAAATTGVATVLTPSAAHADPIKADAYDTGNTVIIQSGCGFKKDPPAYVTYNGFVAATAYWELTCADGNITASGWVDDKRSDGKCAYINAYWPSRENARHHEFIKDCPADGPREEFKWTHPGGSVEVYLSVN